MADFTSRVATLPRRHRAGQPRYPALDAWRAELMTGVRTAYTFDALWRAACAELWAEEFNAQRLPQLAESSLARARRIIAAARKGRAA